MWWSDRRRLLLLLAAVPAAAACGFSPALAPGGTAAALTGQVEPAAPDDRNGFDLVARIEERLGRAAAPRYRLAYSVTTDRIGAGITTTGAITRFTLTGTADFALTEIATGAQVAAGRVEGFTGFFATGTTVATLAAEEDANRRLMRILADRIVTRLIAAGTG
jgi:LPS-assembly lipoprotein